MERNENRFYPSNGYEQQYAPAESIGRYTAKAFLWMFAGLMVTFGVSLWLLMSGTIVFVFGNSYIPLVLMVAEVAVVWILAGRIHAMSVGTAKALFFLYAVLNGVVFSTVFLLYDVVSLVLVFGATALYFGGMAIFGYCTKVDLSRLRNVLISGLIFLIAFGLLSMFIPGLQAFERIYCLIGIVVFLAFTAYDTQKIRGFYQAYQGDGAMLKKASIFSALQLYLDFINIFLYLLRFLGRRK